MRSPYATLCSICYGPIPEGSVARCDKYLGLVHTGCKSASMLEVANRILKTMRTDIDRAWKLKEFPEAVEASEEECLVALSRMAETGCLLRWPEDDATEPGRIWQMRNWAKTHPPQNPI